MMNLKGKDCFVGKDGNFNKDVEHIFKNADGTPTKFGKTLMRETDYDNYRLFTRLSDEAEASRNLMNSAFGGTETERERKRMDAEFEKSYERSIALLNDYYKNERFINAVEKDHDTFKALLTEASSTHDPNDLATLIWSGQMNNEMNTIKYRYADSPYRKNGKSK